MTDKTIFMPAALAEKVRHVIGAFCSMAPLSVEYSEWPELEEMVEEGYEVLNHLEACLERETDRG